MLGMDLFSLLPLFTPHVEIEIQAEVGEGRIHVNVLPAPFSNSSYCRLLSGRRCHHTRQARLLYTTGRIIKDIRYFHGGFPVNILKCFFLKIGAFIVLKSFQVTVATLA